NQPCEEGSISLISGGPSRANTKPLLVVTAHRGAPIGLLVALTTLSTLGGVVVSLLPLQALPGAVVALPAGTQALPAFTVKALVESVTADCPICCCVVHSVLSLVVLKPPIRGTMRVLMRRKALCLRSCRGL